MRAIIFYSLLLLWSCDSNEQEQDVQEEQSPNLYEASESHPFGRPNPNAPDEIRDFEELIGECHCKSVKRIDQDNWGDTVLMMWRWKYIMNGMAIQDETFRENGTYTGNIRQFIPDSARWFVHYYKSSPPSSSIRTWEGLKREDGNIILYNDQKAANGMDGDYRITLSNITKSGFSWDGEWVDKGETFSYPTLKIVCKR